MKIASLFENLDLSPEEIDKIDKWLELHVSGYKHLHNSFNFRNGLVNCSAHMLTIENFSQQYDEIPKSFKFGRVEYIGYVSCELINFDLLPEHATGIYLNGCDELPTSFAGISKIVKSCETLTIPMLAMTDMHELFSIPRLKGIKCIDNSKLGFKPKRYSEDVKFGEACKIVNDCLSKGEHLFDCHIKLEEKGLDRFL